MPPWIKIAVCSPAVLCSPATLGQDASQQNNAVADINFIPDGLQSEGPQSETPTVQLEIDNGKYSVRLTWHASRSPNIAGYNIYRSEQSGGPYHKLNSTLHVRTSFTDNDVVVGKTYYYVTTAVNSSGEQSSYSNQAEASIP